MKEEKNLFPIGNYFNFYRDNLIGVIFWYELKNLSFS